MQPKSIKVSRSDKRLSIEWDDGQLCEYSFAELRAACPCAECRRRGDAAQEAEAAGGLEIPLVDARATELVEVEPAGNYGVKLGWRDGHRFGIYTWDYLRGLCREV